MMMQISELVKAQGGLVLSRKETKASGNGGCPYKRLTLRALTEDGEIDSSALEDFCASETLSHAWFASPGDVVIRLFLPLCPVVIEEGQEKLLVPSQLAILKVKDCTILLPEFLKISLSQKEIQEKIRRIESGTTQRVVKLGTIMELQIEVPDKETKRRVVEMDTLCRKKERMYLKLMEQERQLTEIAIRKIMGGTLR